MNKGVASAAPLFVRKEQVTMTAKDYLLELAEMQDDIEAKKELRQEYLEMAASISAPMNEIRVQTSHVSDGKMENMTIMAADLAEEIEADATNYYEHQHLIMKQIHALHNVSYIQVLFKVYVQFKSIKVASDEMKMSYQYVRNIHKKALAAFGTCHADMLAERENNGKIL